MRRYAISFEAQAVTTAKDLLYLAAPSTMTLCVIRAWIGQDGGVTSEMGRVLIQRCSTTNSGTGITPQPLEVGDPASSATAGYLTTDNTRTGIPEVGPRPFNWVVGDEWVPSPEERIWIPPSGKLVYRLDLAPGASKTVSAGLIFIEVG